MTLDARRHLDKVSFILGISLEVQTPDSTMDKAGRFETLRACVVKKMEWVDLFPVEAARLKSVGCGSADIIESLVLLFKKSISRDQIYQVKGKGKDGKLTKSVGIPGMPLATLIANLVDQTQPAEGCTATNPDKTMVYYSRPFRPSNVDFLPEFEQSQAPESAYREHITGVRATAYQELSAVGADRSRIVSDSGPRREAPRLGPWRASIAVLSHHGVAKPPCAICQCSIDLDATLHPKFRTSDAENKTALEGNLNNDLCVEGRFLVAVSDLGSA